MRAFVSIVLSAILATSAIAQEQMPVPVQQEPNTIKECSDTPNSGFPSCNVSKKDQKAAKKYFESGLKYRKSGSLPEALESFKRAAHLNPADVEYITAREIVKQQLVYATLERANQDFNSGRKIEAMAGFSYAMEIDPKNEFAKQRVLEALGSTPKLKPALLEDRLSAAREIHADPKPITKDFKFRGQSTELMNQVAAAYGITASIDESVKPRPVRMEVQGVDFDTAMGIVTKLTKTFWTPLSTKMVLFAADTEPNRRTLERTAMRTFYVPEATTPQALNDLVNVMRVLFEVRFITQNTGASTITVRAPSPVLDAVSRWFESLSDGRPQVSLDVQTFAVSHSFARQIGVSVPQNFQLFNIPTEAAKLLGNQSIQDIINQLVSSGAINQANTTAISALIAQALGQSGSSLLSSGFAVFGGGITLMALSLGSSSFHFNQSTSDVQTLEHLTIPASQGNAATIKIGERYPILNSSFAPIFNSAAISQVLQNGSFQAPFPSFNYEDLGIDLKATPQIHRDTEVTLEVELQMRQLGTQTLNGAPVISNREYKGAITLKNGEPAVLAGMTSRSDQRSVNGMPFFSRIPLAGLAFSEHDKSIDESELLIIITPHITRMVDEKGPLEMVMPATMQK